MADEWMNECSSVVEWQWQGELAVCVEKPVSVPLSHTSHAGLPGINPGPLLWQGGD